MIQNYLNGACWEMGVGVHTNRMLRRYFVAAHTSLWAQKTRRLGSVDFNTFCVRRTLCKVGILLSIMQIVVFILFIVFFLQSGIRPKAALLFYASMAVVCQCNILSDVVSSSVWYSKHIETQNLMIHGPM